MDDLIKLTSLRRTPVQGFTYWTARVWYRAGRLRCVKIGRALYTSKTWIEQAIERDQPAGLA